MLAIIGYILLWILRILGILLAVVVSIIGIILFVPFKYNARGEFQEKIDVSVRFSWLFSLINGKMHFDGQANQVLMRFLVFIIYPKKTKKKKVKKKKAKIQKAKIQKAKTMPSQTNMVEKPLTHDVAMDSAKSAAKDVGIEPVSDLVSESVLDTIDSVQDSEAEESHQKEVEPGKVDLESDMLEEKSNKSKKVKKPKKEKKEGKNGIIEGIETMKHYWELINREENEGVLRHVTKYLVKIIRWILPSKLVVDMEIGLDDPAITGYIAGVASLVFVISKRNIRVVPNFNDKVIHGQFNIKGRLFLFQIIYYIIRVVADKRVRRLIKEVRK